MTQTDLFSNRIARRLTSIAVVVCGYGAYVWLGRSAEPDQLAWLAFYAIAASVMLASRAHLAGIDLYGWTQTVVGVGRRGVDGAIARSRPIARRAAPVAIAVLVVTSTMGGLALVGTHSVTDGQSGTASAETDAHGLSNDTIEEYNLNMTTAAETGGSVFVGSNGGSVYSIDASTGEEEWSFATGNSVETSPTVVDGSVYVGSNDNSVYSIDASTGEEEWSFSAGDSVRTSPTVVDGSVYIGSNDNSVYSIDVSTGEEEWSFATDNGVTSSPTVVDGSVYVGSDDHSVYSIDASTGEEEWSFATGSSVTSPTVVDGSVYVGSFDNSVYSIDASTGEEEWSFATGDDVRTSPTVVDGSVYVGSNGGSVYSIDASTGEREWSFATGNRVISSPTVADGSVYVGSWDNSVYSIDASTGEEEWSFATGDVVYSSPTVADGSVYVGSFDNSVYSIDASTGEEEWSFSAGGSVYSSPTFVAGGENSSSGSRVMLRTLGHHSGSLSGGSGTPDLNGTVSTQTNDGVANATVQLAISKQPSFAQADAQLDELSNPIPSAYEEQLQNGFDLLGDDGFLEDTDGSYAAIYDPSDLGLTYKDSADLSEPKITNIEPGEEQALIIGDTTADCGVFGINTNEYNGQIAGCVQPEGNVTIEKLSGTGEVVATDSVSVEEAGNQRDFGGPTDVHYATYTFAEGIYQISAETEDGDGISYMVKAGDPTPDFNRFAETIENTRTEQAQNLRNAIDQDLLEVKTVTTNETGYWEASLPDNTRVVSVSARKAPSVDVDPANLTYENMSDAYNAADAPNASVYLPSRTKRISPPAQNVDVTLREVAFPGFADMDRLQTRFQELKNKLNNLTMDDLPQQLLQRMETESRANLAKAWGSLRGTLVNFDPAREAYLEVSDREEVPTADELSKSELQAAIQNANVAITRSSSTGALTEAASDTTEDAISQTWELAGIPLDQANVSVVADYSNGTSRVVDDEYLETNSGIVGADTISVQEFPLGEDDPEQVSFRLRVAGSDEFASKTTSALNPTFSGETPSIDAVEVTSLQPGPDDRVTVEVHPDSESTFREVTNMSVRGPDGESIERSNISDGTTASFTTDGAGVHSIRFTIESTAGGTFTDVVQLEAADTDETLRPSIYAHSGPLGTYALVGDGFESGDVETTSTGSLEIVGQLGNDAEVPNTVDVFTEGVDVGTESATSVRIVRGESRQNVRANVPIVFHAPILNSPDDARSHKTLVRANGNPVAWDGSTRFGVVEMDNDGTSIRAFTGDDGVLTLSLDNTPSWWERTNFSLDTNYPWIPLTAGTSPLLGGFVVVSRRRSAN